MSDKVNFDRHGLWRTLSVAITALSLSGSAALAATKTDAAPLAPTPTYARVADLVTTVPAMAVVSVRKMSLVPAERSPGLAPGQQRFLVEADTLALIRSNNVLSRRMSFLLDLPSQPKGRPPKWAKRSFLIFGKVEERVDFFQLLSSESIMAWSAENEAFVRRVGAEMAATDAPPLIEGIDSVFHVGGAVAGEGETQIFLRTADGSPISLSIIRRPDEAPHFGVSLGEVVDEAADMPAPDTPLWYRLACFLPERLPAAALAGQTTNDAAAAVRDYEAFRSALAFCDREAQPLL